MIPEHEVRLIQIRKKAGCAARNEPGMLMPDSHGAAVGKQEGWWC